ncbi:MAG: hypothetical protein Q4A56_07735 [Porphyromonadaceae bacterium]|nr:hypothetical protein [Porphyromonadaceae bacterium]
MKRKTFSITPSTKNVTIRFNKVARKRSVKKGKKFAVPREAVEVVIQMPRKRKKVATKKIKP